MLTQDDLRAKIEDLQTTLKASNNEWDSWEKEFITDMSSKLRFNPIHLTPPQQVKVVELWDKI